MKYVHHNRDNLWNSFAGKITPISILNTIIGIPSFSQSDMRRLAKGNFQIIFCALHPPEQQILFTRPDGILGHIVDELAAQVISIPDDKIRAYRMASYDHYEQLQKELNLLIQEENSCRKVYVDGKRKKCTYKITRNFEEVREVIEFNKRNHRKHKIAIVLTVEGLHSLGRGHVDIDNVSNPNNVDDTTFLKRIDQMKGLDTDLGSGWLQTPIVANITHAFENGICGHAQALSEPMRKHLFEYAEEHNSQNDNKGLNQPLSNLGKIAIQRMLGIDDVSRDRAEPGRRIIPDIKHMSVKTRQDYYQMIEAHNADHPADIIPVIMSHSAVNGKPSYLSDMNLNPSDQEEEYKCSETFNPFSINLYDDELIKIHETKGLMGLILDERILSGGVKLKLLEKYVNNNHDYDNPYAVLGYNNRKTWLTLITDQIKHVVETVSNGHTTVDKKLIWDRICIGTDFDGQIDPINGYKKAKSFPRFKEDLTDLLSTDQFAGLLHGLSVDEAVNKICFENVYNFLERHWK